MVAFCAFAGKFWAAVSGLSRVVMPEKGRARRAKNDGIVAMSTAETTMRRGASRFRVAALVGYSVERLSGLEEDAEGIVESSLGTDNARIYILNSEGAVVDSFSNRP